MVSPAAFPTALRAFALLWLFCALAVGKLHLLARLPIPAVPAIIFALAALLILAYRRWDVLRGWVDALDLRLLVLLHVSRFVGFYFIHLESRGLLPPEFFQAGIGDIITATLALAVCFLPLSPALRLRAITIWNVIGLMDILLVLFNAARTGLADPGSLAPLTHLPLSLLPTFLVPLILATHVIIFLRIRQISAERN
jgi:hypothetical protein